MRNLHSLGPDINVWEFSIKYPGLSCIEGELFLTYVVTPTPFGNGDRDTMFFPKKVNGNYAVLHRPNNWIGSKYKTRSPGIWFAFFNDRYRYLYGHRLVMAPENYWESKKIGAGPPPILIEYGWLLIYHGVDENSVYRVGAVLLDKEKPWKV